MIDDYVVLRFDNDGHKTGFGPIVAASPQDAIHRLALGEAKGRKFHNHDPLPYVATGRGRYVAIPLHVWQDGVFEYTKTHGTRKVVNGEVQDA